MKSIDIESILSVKYARFNPNQPSCLSKPLSAKSKRRRQCADDQSLPHWILCCVVNGWQMKKRLQKNLAILWNTAVQNGMKTHDFPIKYMMRTNVVWSICRFIQRQSVLFLFFVYILCLILPSSGISFAAFSCLFIKDHAQLLTKAIPSYPLSEVLWPFIVSFKADQPIRTGTYWQIDGTISNA